MRYLAPLVLLTLVGCYSPRTVGQGTAYPEAHDRWGPGALEAQLWYDEITGHASFTVNRPAHVAVFALRPGASLEMLYPSVRYGGMNRRFASGNHWIQTRGSPHRFAGNWSTVHGAGPVYILLIASEQPLEVSRYLHTSGMSWFTSPAMTHSPYLAINSLAQDIVPTQHSTEWTSAVYVVWPESNNYRRGYTPTYVNIRCPSGVVLTVPTEAWRRGYVHCPTEAVPTPPDSASGPDSTSIRDGVPQRPVPPGWIQRPAEGDGVEAPRIGSVAEREHTRERPGRPGVDGRPLPTRGSGVQVTPAVPPRPLIGSGVGARSGDGRPAARRGATIPSASRPARPSRSGDRATSRPEARPTRPAARPANRPEARPQPAKRPERPARPAPKPKPKPDPDNDAGWIGARGSGGRSP